MNTAAQLGWDVTPEKIEEAVRRIVQTAQPAKIIAFGSWARGDAREDSDLDLLVIEQDVTDPIKESIRLRRVLKGLELPVDVLVASNEKFDYWRETPGHLYYEVAQEGKILYEAA